MRQRENLKVEDDKTNRLLVKVQSEKAKAEKKAEEVGVQKRECEEKAAAIMIEKEEAPVRFFWVRFRPRKTLCSLLTMGNPLSGAGPACRFEL